MSEKEIKDEVETEEFTDELSDEALDREGEKMPRRLYPDRLLCPRTDR